MCMECLFLWGGGTRWVCAGILYRICSCILVVDTTETIILVMEVYQNYLYVNYTILQITLVFLHLYYLTLNTYLYIYYIYTSM